jgi:putative oxidoreductase
MGQAVSMWERYVRSILRIVAGFTFLLHGLQKLPGLLGGLGGQAAAPMSMMWFAGVIEDVGGVLMILGLFTRPVAFVLCGEMAVAYFLVHIHMGFWPLLNGGEITVLYCFIFLYLVTAGPGPFSLDHLVRKKTS